jgi:integrase
VSGKRPALGGVDLAGGVIRVERSWDPHEARHTFASLMIAPGVNAKALSTHVGHANISITYDRGVALVTEVKNGKTISVRGYLDPNQALEAVGLSEQDAHGGS